MRHILCMYIPGLDWHPSTIQSNRSYDFAGITLSCGLDQSRWSAFPRSSVLATINASGGRHIALDVGSINMDDLSNDFSNTFMLDEELEFEQKKEKKDDLSSVRRYRKFPIFSDSLLWYILVVFLFFYFSTGSF